MDRGNHLPPPNGWNEYQNLVLSELKRLDVNLTVLSNKIEGIRQSEIAILQSDMQLLKYKCTFFGAIGGSLPGLVYLLTKIFGL